MIQTGKWILFFSFWEQLAGNNGKYLNLKSIYQKIILEIFIHNKYYSPMCGQMYRT